MNEPTGNKAWPRVVCQGTPINIFCPYVFTLTAWKSDKDNDSSSEAHLKSSKNQYWLLFSPKIIHFRQSIWILSRDPEPYTGNTWSEDGGEGGTIVCWPWSVSSIGTALVTAQTTLNKYLSYQTCVDLNPLTPCWRKITNNFESWTREKVEG